MNKGLISAFLATILTLLVGCQTLSGERAMAYDDTSVTTSVKAALVDSKVRTNRMHVETNQGTVVLSGSVRSAHEKNEATQIASQVPGVKIVKNLLVIRRR